MFRVNCFKTKTGDNKTAMWVWLIFLSATVDVEGFNLDVESRLLYRGPTGSGFGASLDFHRETNGGGAGLVVGAPFALDAAAGSVATGAVFRCPGQDGLVANSTCHRLPLQLADAKPDQMMGATVRTSPSEDLIVACAPRYWYKGLRGFSESWNLVGNCLLARRNMTRIQEFSPCKNREFKRAAWFEEGFCQAGTSAAITQNGDIVFGAPGSYLWEGQIFSIDRLTLDLGQTDQRQNYFDDYSGMSVAAGDLSGSGEEDYAIGGPRAKRIMGLVSIVNKNMEFITELIGEQLASGFGSSLCVTDVNGDGRQDLLIGAPYYSVLSGPTMQGDVGRVYVFLCRPELRYCGLVAAKGSIRDTTPITGRSAGGRFGTAMAALGDMDSDGFNDVAVGAPYAGKTGEGVVYIFRGSPEGQREEPSLTIEASSVGPGLKSFGYSLSGGVDVDGNLYPDLAVGAFESDAATVFRSVPVIDIVTAVLSVRPRVVDTETRRCTTADGGRAACFSVMLCVEYGGHGVPDTQDFLVDVVLDGPLLPLQRSVLKQDKSQLAMSLLRRQTSCMMLEVHLKDEIRDKLTPIAVEATLSLPKQPITGQLSPVLRPDAETHLSTHVNMSRNCGLDDVCVPDLRVQAHGSTTTIYVGDTTSVVLEVAVSNRGEESYESQLFVLVPEEVDYVGAQRMESNTPAMCSYTPAGTGGTIHCGVGNPLKADATVVLQLRFLAANLNGSRSFLDFPIFANSSTPDDVSTTGDNQVVFSAQVVVEAEVTVKGASLPRHMWLDSTFAREDENGKDRPKDRTDTDAETEAVISQIKHVYEVRNHGPSDVGQTIATVLWPATTEDSSVTVTVPVVTLKNQQGYCLVDNATTLMCENAEDCYIISCIVNGLGNGGSFVIAITSEIKDVQFSSLGNTTEDLLVSTARVVVMDMPYSISPTALPTAQTNVTTSIILPRPVTRRKRVKAWIIASAVLSGLMLLVAIALVLYRLGFFDRKKVSKEDDVFDAHDRDVDSGIQEDEDGSTLKGP
ncbi:integrin alpha-8-like [Branchiostoma floridae x Branchiostoma japonicum]